mgnify:FL=1
MRRACLGTSYFLCLLFLSVVEAQPNAQFVDITALTGITFDHHSGATGNKYLPETLGAGTVMLDVDGDSWQDLLFVNSTDLPLTEKSETTAALYRNNGNGTFTNITANSGLNIPIYGIGGTAADYNNDGHTDIYLTAVGPNHLFRGQGDGTFVDVTTEAGVGDDRFSTSALWFDYDNDGAVDLFVGNYVDWNIDNDLFCSLDGERKSYCTPESYSGQRPTLYRNRGDGTFADVTATAGLDDPSLKALGVTMFDHDNDGWIDLFVANDTEPDRLYHNQRNGTFEDIGVIAGVAFSETGIARAGMGVDAADYDRSGRPSLMIGHFSNEMIALYHNEGNSLFIDEAPRSAIGRTSLLTLAFGCFFFDYNLDGLLDIFVTNGHVADDVERVQSRVTYAQPPHLFRNRGNGEFEEVVPDPNSVLARPLVGRGAAYGDLDNDGDLDIVVTTNDGPAQIIRNDVPRTGNVLRVQLIGTTSNRDGIGARVEIKLKDEPTRWRLVKTGSSYASQSERPITFGLAKTVVVNSLRVTWPSGQTDVVANVVANQSITVREYDGIIAATPIGYAQ